MMMGMDKQKAPGARWLAVGAGLWSKSSAIPRGLGIAARAMVVWALGQGFLGSFLILVLMGGSWPVGLWAWSRGPQEHVFFLGLWGWAGLAVAVGWVARAGWAARAGGGGWTRRVQLEWMAQKQRLGRRAGDAMDMAGQGAVAPGVGGWVLMLRAAGMGLACLAAGVGLAATMVFWVGCAIGLSPRGWGAWWREKIAALESEGAATREMAQAERWLLGRRAKGKKSSDALGKRRL